MISIEFDGLAAMEENSWWREDCHLGPTAITGPGNSNLGGGGGGGDGARVEG